MRDNTENVKELIGMAKEYVEEFRCVVPYKDYIDVKVELYDYICSLKTMVEDNPEKLIKLLEETKDDMEEDLEKLGYDTCGDKIYIEDMYYTDGRLD